MTATITPPAGVPALQRVDPAERLVDYERALSFYVGLPASIVNRVVFAENSGAELGSLRAIADRRGAGKEVELVSFDGLDYPVAHGRAVGEMRLIETALSVSRLLAALGEDEPFWKVTGRLRFTNLGALIATAPEGTGLYVDFRRHPRPWVDTRVFASTPRAFRELLLSRVDLLRQDELEQAGFSAPEERLFGELLPERERGRIAPRLRYEPRIEGHSGQGEDYARPARRAWSATRAIVRRVCPPLWI
jgi:hypothetical protein